MRRASQASRVEWLNPMGLVMKRLERTLAVFRRQKCCEYDARCQH